MTDSELNIQIAELEQACASAGLRDPQILRSRVARIIRSLNAQAQPIPFRLEQVEERLDEEVGEDFFDNMPV